MPVRSGIDAESGRGHEWLPAGGRASVEEVQDEKEEMLSDGVWMKPAGGLGATLHQVRTTACAHALLAGLRGTLSLAL